MKKVRILKMKKISIGKKVGGVITLAAAFVIGVAPMTAFAQENPSASEIRILARSTISDSRRSIVIAIMTAPTARNGARMTSRISMATAS